MVEDGETYDQLRGVELAGWGEIIDDPVQLMVLGVSVWERYYGPFTEDQRPFVDAMLNKRVLIRLHTEKVVSWDHRKLGAASAG
jgi:hypothetical protein